jgi:Inhibitor of apoptosis-promoting Bax1
MSLYGYTTQRDLTGFGSFLFMGLIGIIIASSGSSATAAERTDFGSAHPSFAGRKPESAENAPHLIPRPSPDPGEFCSI